jgi:L-histidine Nalpha-methyltransferase
LPLAVVQQNKEQLYEAYANDVKEGLSHPPYSIPTKYLYDDRGSNCFDRYTASSPQYYPAVEREIVDAYAAALGEVLDVPQIVELGAGSCRRLRQLIELRVIRETSSCRALDVSDTPLMDGLSSVIKDNPRLRATACVGDFEIWETDEYVDANLRTTLLWFGNTVANSTAGQLKATLGKLGSGFRFAPDLILGIDLSGKRRNVDERFPDPQGLFSEFRWNALARLNRTFEGSFEREGFFLNLAYNEKLAQAESLFVPRYDQTVQLKRLGLAVSFGVEDNLVVGITRDYDRQTISELLSPIGWRLQRVFGSDASYCLAQFSFCQGSVGGEVDA